MWIVWTQLRIENWEVFFQNVACWTQEHMDWNPAAIVWRHTTHGGAMKPNPVLQTVNGQAIQLTTTQQTHETALAEVVVFVVTHLPAGSLFKERWERTPSSVGRVSKAGHTQP